MATLKQLYDLVHSLDKAEKKNLSIMVDALGGKAKQRYADALHIINETKEFDTEKLKKKLSIGFSGMSLTEANDNVFKFICKFLIGQQTHTTGNLGLLKEMTLVEVFISKGLFEIAEKHLEPLLQKLEKGNSFGLLARGRELHSIVTASNPTTNRDYVLSYSIIEKRIQGAKDHLQYLEVIKLNQQFVQLIHTIGEPREKKHLVAYEAIIKNPVWQAGYSDVSVQTFSIFAPLKVDIVNYTQGPVVAVAECKKALHEFYQRFSLKHHYVLGFYLLDSLVSDAIRAKDITTILEALPELKKLIVYTEQKAVLQKINAKIMQGELAVALFSKKYSEGMQCMEHWLQPAIKQEWEQAPLAYMNYMFGARVCYMGGNPSRALDFLNYIQPNEKDFRAASLISYRFLYLLCYYQLDNPSLVFSTATSIYKSLLKQEKLYLPEKAILKFAKSGGTVEKKQQNLKELYDSLLTYSNDPLHTSFFQFADYVEWLEEFM